MYVLCGGYGRLANRAMPASATVGAWRDMADKVVCQVWPVLACCTQYLYERSIG